MANFLYSKLFKGFPQTQPCSGRCVAKFRQQIVRVFTMRHLDMSSHRFDAN